ncbi:MAG TPA: HlyD family type I secretion periplasmic adaptor subunit, partial [Rhizomicrobium sp.]|nr:HlyD family type I secretion periplasmic adaptor subunit [Rhizomicrobium sp.]
DMRTKLYAASAGSRSDVLDATEALQQQQSLLEQQTLQLNQARKNIDSIRSEMFASLDEFAADDAGKMNEAQRQADSYRQQVARASASLDHATLRSPIDGIVESSAARSVGQVVGASEQLMEIVPSRTPLEVRCWIPDSEIGFVRNGQRAIIKVDAYPFTQYGLLEGVVARVARDSVADPALDASNGSPRAGQSEASARPTPLGPSYFPITVRLSQSALLADGATIPLSSGMSVSVEIKTDSRRLIDYLLSPLSRASSESLRER